MPTEKGTALMMSTAECTTMAVKMEAKADACLDPSATALYRLLAGQWRYLHGQAVWQDLMIPRLSHPAAQGFAGFL